MTREEKIALLVGELEYIRCDNFDADTVEDKTLKEAIRVIKTLEQEPREDAISRNELLKAIDTWDKFGCDANTKLVPYQDHYIPYIHYDDVVKCIKGMPPVNPQPKTGYCKDCKWWKDSDGVYRRGVGAESQCPINRIEVFEGNGYCYMFESQESEVKE